MNLEPDCAQATAEQQGVTTVVSAVLDRMGYPDTEVRLLSYPALIAVVNDLQRLPPEAPAARHSAVVTAVQAALAAAEMSRQRAHRLDCPVWAVDLAPPEPHLSAGLTRALAQIPARPDRVIDVRVADWTQADRAVFCAAAGLLAESWPDMLDELAVGVRQIALLRGYGITGFSDFSIPGAVFINAERFDDRDGLPGALRLAENLVHEGAHTRCYTAALAAPFLNADRAGVRVTTPLRADPRPLFGLFQQLVVLCRCAELYDRVTSETGAPAAIPAAACAAAQSRKAALSEQARQALTTLHSHADKLTDHGRAILTQAAAALGAAAAPAR